MSGNVAVLITIAILIGLSTLLTYTLERPALNVIRRAWKNRKSAGPV
jgi:peptidoglycan/LPS O-acetylase OafA/YrhL